MDAGLQAALVKAASRMILGEKMPARMAGNHLALLETVDGVGEVAAFVKEQVSRQSLGVCTAQHTDEVGLSGKWVQLAFQVHQEQSSPQDDFVYTLYFSKRGIELTRLLPE